MDRERRLDSYMSLVFLHSRSEFAHSNELTEGGDGHRGMALTC